MTITISAPDIQEKLSEGANTANLTVEAYTENVLRSALAAPSVSDEIPKPSAYYTLEVDKSPAAVQAVLDVLKSFDEDDLEDRRQSAEYLRRALDEDRLSNRPLFPTEPETITPNHAMLTLMQDLQDSPGRMTSGEDVEDLLRFARSGAMYGEVSVQPWGLVPIFYDPESTKEMPADIKAAVEAYLDILRGYQYPLPIIVTKIEVNSWIDPENGSRHWRVIHWLDAPADEAMAYWEAVDTEIEQKLGTLSLETAELLRYEIATDVEWNCFIE